MNFIEEIKYAESEVIIIGAVPLLPELENFEKDLADILQLRPDLRVTVYFESKSEIFSQSLCLELDGLSYTKLLKSRSRVFGEEVENEKNRTDTLSNKVANNIVAEHRDEIKTRIEAKQVHCRIPINIVYIDDKIWACSSLTKIPVANDYILIEKEDYRYQQYSDYVMRFQTKWKAFSSQLGDEIIEVFDRSGYPHGTLPRKAFYTEAYSRHVVWMFVFNRKGEILLHKRSEKTKDNRLLWDKSTGGHVSITDSSTTITAKRELVEEMYLPNDDLTDYISANIGDVVDYGEWNPIKKPEATFPEQFHSLQSRDWVLFRSTDSSGKPIIIEEVIKRRISLSEKEIIKRPTVMKAELFFLIAPPGQLDDERSMRASLEHESDGGAAADHKLITINKLLDWKKSEEEEGNLEELFTNDLVYLLENYSNELESFADFVEYLGRK